MNYLIYIELAAENLQFFLWHRDYSKRFSELPASKQALAPEWTNGRGDGERPAAQTNSSVPKKVGQETAAILKVTDFAQPKVTVSELHDNPFHTPPRTPGIEDGRKSSALSEWNEDASTIKSSIKSFPKKAAGPFDAGDAKWQPCISPLVRTVS